MILLSHPTGNPNVRQALRALNDGGLLSQFWTSICWDQGHLLNRVLPESVCRELKRRTFSHVSRDQLRCYPWIEMGRLAARRLDLSSLLRHEVGRFSVDAVYRDLDSRIAAGMQEVPNLRGIYAYEDGALASFRKARQLGLRTIYELPIGYWKCYRELAGEEKSLQPDWAATLQGGVDSEEKLQRKDEELALATDIIVPSEFVRDTLRKAGPLEGRITVLPYGAPASPLEVRIGRRAMQGKLKILFVGGLSQRKGLSYLLQAVQRIQSEVELTLVGRKVAECRPLDEALRIHRWIPSISHSALLEEMSRHDVMVFPSLFEGCALVVLEAMSQGVPVITTPNAGSSQIISDGDDGFIVPIRDVEAIVQRLEMLVQNRDLLAALSQAAMRKAAQHSWERYRRLLADVVRLAVTNITDVPSSLLQSSTPQVRPAC